MPELEQQRAGRAIPPSFIDLRQFAADRAAGIQLAPAQDGDAFLSNRRLLDLPDGPVTIGAIALDAGNGTVPSHPADEFIIVSDGALTLEQQGRALVLNKGDSVVLPRGAGFAWKADGPVTLLFMRYGGSEAGEDVLVPIDQAAALEPSGAPLAELLVGPTPQCRNHTDYRSANGEFVCGTWDSSPYHRRAMRYGHYELMYLLDGSVTFEDETGRGGTFAKGDIFLVEQHAQCSWESRENVAKVYAIYRPV